MANKDNLNLIRSENEAREKGRNGGKKSGETRRKKKMLRDCLDILLERKVTDKNGRKVTGAEALAVQLFQKALGGDLKAFELVRDTAGQKPIDKVMVSEVDPTVIDEVERLVSETESEHDA